MDSQVTLVDPSPLISLRFNVDNMANTTLSLNSTPIYTISTDSRGASTEIRAANTNVVLARILRKGMLPDTISFPTLSGGKEVRVNKWLKPVKLLADGTQGSMIETEGEAYVLRKYRLHRLAPLFPEHDTENPAAYLQRPTVATPLPLAIMLQPGTENFRVPLIAAFIIQEQKTRTGRGGTAGCS
ncbi:hypothetical protein C8R43DRAFT_1186882 [Mycena crocata]|nr:hypothetical protein C8R43DRAFT_1186882 [Mycena crocata]